MLRSRVLTTLSLGCLTLVSLATPTRAADELAWKWTAGDIYQVEIERTLDQTTDVLLRPAKISAKSTIAMQWRVESVGENGEARVEQRFTRVAVTMTSSRGETMAWDSASTTRPAGIAAQLRTAVTPLLEAPILTTLSRRGEVLDITFPETTTAALEAAPDAFGLKSILTPESLRDMLRNMAATLPSEPVETGAAWSLTRETGSPDLPFTIKHELTYDGPRPLDDRNLSHISVKTELQAAADAPKRSDGSPVPNLAEQEGNGELWFDLEAGHPVRSEHRQKLVTESPLREMTIKVTAESVLRTTIQKQTR